MPMNNERLELIKETLKDAVAVMDESGKSDGHGSQLLWDKHWNEVRMAMVWSLDEIDKVLLDEI